MNRTPLALKAWGVLCLVFLVGPALRAQTRLLYPRISFEDEIITGLAIVNPTDRSATITFTVYQPDGTLLESEGFQNPATRTIDAGQQFSETTGALFGLAPEDSSIAWVEATSDVSDLTGFFLVLNSEVSFFDGADLPVASPEIVFPDVRTGTGFSTELNVVNPGPESTTVVLSLVQGDQTITHETELAGRGVLRSTVSELFSNAQPMGEPAGGGTYVTLSASQPVAGFSLVMGGRDVYGLNARPRSEVLNRLYFPQLAVLEPFITELTMINSGQEPAIVTVTAHQPNGNLYSVPDLTRNPVVMVIESGRSVRQELESLFGFSGDQPLEGWIEVESTSLSINGSLSYSIPGLQSIASVATVASGHQQAVFSHIATTLGFFTGIAMLNPGTLAANVRVTALEPDGQLIGDFTLTLQPRQRVSSLLVEMIPEADGRGSGFIWISSDIPIYLTSLFGSLQSGVLANIPPQAVPEDFRPDTTTTVTVDPSLSILSPGGRQAFRLLGATGDRAWSVDGVPGGNTILGTISENGSFVAPAIVPTPLPLTITARTDSQIAGASVDVVVTNNYASGLGLIQSVAYLGGLERLFIAELLLPSQTLAEASPAQNEMSVISDVTSGIADPLISLEDDISKLVAFTGIDDVEYLLLSGRSSGTIRRLDLSSLRTTVVARDLNSPTSMVIDPLTGALLVAEANEVTVIPETQLNLLLSATPTDSESHTPVAPRAGFGGIVPRGVTVNSCTGDILVSDAANQSIVSIDRVTAKSTTLFSGLLNPGQLLGLIREGVPCPAAFHLFIVEEGADRVTLAIPASGTIVPWALLPGVRDLTFVPDSSAITAARGIGTGSEEGDITFGAVPDLYRIDPSNPLVLPGPTSCVGIVTFADSSLESAVRAALGISEGAGLTCARAAALTRLEAANLGIVDLEGMEALTGLEELNLTENQISDISPLGNLTSLTSLDLRDNQVSDISAVEGLTGLTLLSFAFNQVQDISAVSELHDLESLFLGVNQIEDITAVAGLEKLTLLGLGRNSIDASDLEAISGLTQLEILGLTGNRLTDVSALADLTQLTRLLLGGNRISDISVLRRMTRLNDLELPFNRITDISPLADLIELTDLWLESNDIRSLSALANLTELNNLNLDTNEISGIGPLIVNEGLGEGDLISLRRNLLSLADCLDIQTLIDRGADVVHDLECP